MNAAVIDTLLKKRRTGTLFHTANLGLVQGLASKGCHTGIEASGHQIVVHAKNHRTEGEMT